MCKVRRKRGQRASPHFSRTFQLHKKRLLYCTTIIYGFLFLQVVFLSFIQLQKTQLSRKRKISTKIPGKTAILQNTTLSRCLKITEKVSFNIASEASYVYILSGQKFNKKCQKWSNLASF